MIYQGSGSNVRRGLVIVIGNWYVRVEGRGFNPTKTKFRLKCEALGGNLYSIGDAQQANRYTKTMEVILKYIQGNFNKGNDVNKAL